ncbi:hypothetical protein P8452_41840 [Trifolium repens]|nr:hypothetical protein P8452_41840 [Trifolium repens]
MKIHRSLPVRPGIDEVEAAKGLILNVEKEDQIKFESIGKQSKGNDVPDELFMILQEMQKNFVYFQSNEQKREAFKLLDLENVHSLFDELIQRASDCVSNGGSSGGAGSDFMKLVILMVSSVVASSSLVYVDKEVSAKPSELFTRDDSYVSKSKTKSTFYPNGYGIEPNFTSKPQIMDSSLKSTAVAGQDGDKLSLIKLASIIEVSAKKGTHDLKLQGKLMDQVDWLPDLLGKLSSLATLDLSENRIVAIPSTIGGL